MKKVLLVYGYGLKNSGDMAITEGSIDYLVSYNIELKVLLRYNRQNPEFEETVNYLENRYKDWPVSFIENPFTLDRSKSGWNSIYNYLKGGLIVSGLRNDKTFNTLVEWSDYIFFNGGNLIRCKNFTDFARLKALFFPLKLAIKKNKEFSILSQSTSTINKSGKKIIGEIIKSSNKVFLREPLSYEKILEIFPSSKNKLLLGADMAFFINRDFDLIESNIVLKKNTIGITLRMHGIGDLHALPNKLKTSILNNIISLAKALLSEGFSILLISQSIKDDNATEEVFNLIKGSVRLIKERDPQKLRVIYSNIDALIGMRLHSIILATLAGTPSFGYFVKEWGLKNPGMMNMLSLPYKFVDEGDIEIDKIKHFINHKNQYADRMNISINSIKKTMNDNLKYILNDQPTK